IALAYDTIRGQTVLFGGTPDGITFFSDTWTWDGTTWTQRFPATSPTTPRGYYRVAYDAARQQVVLFGGQGPNNNPLYDDTWVWDGVNWTQKFPATKPSGRTLPAMAYDEARSQIALFGGFTGSFTNDTWVWGPPASSTCSIPPSGNGPISTSNPQGTTSEPISTGNGNYYYQHTDFVIPGRGMPLVFQRSYNSLDNYAGPLGTNWTHSYNVFLTGASSGIVI